MRWLFGFYSFVALILITALETGGPYAIIVFLGIAYYRKDKQYSELMMDMMDVIDKNTSSNTKLETTLSNLRDVIMVLIGKKE